MPRINGGRVILGGLLAGLVLNIGEYIVHEMLLKAKWELALSLLDLKPAGGATIGWLIVMTFMVGIIIVWLYAAMRPRFGPGPKTAILASVITWFLGWLFALIPPLATGILPADLVWTITGLGLVETIAAGLVGGLYYREE